MMKTPAFELAKALMTLDAAHTRLVPAKDISREELLSYAARNSATR